ncbi:hypothetical protein T11_6035 [Trichinella zimbabwensis]|uniref:Uncharacterized protein n=1 Tax=Trichinella zimbabwensis TaxID=268475 RepID=A0A0V1GDC9_9BILA|nr:hypothetical protein T11_6035 [Trichinella zimbabwensis]
MQADILLEKKVRDVKAWLHSDTLSSIRPYLLQQGQTS